MQAELNPVINNKHGYVLTITQIPGEHEEEVPDNVIKNVLQKKNVVRKLSGKGKYYRHSSDTRTIAWNIFKIHTKPKSVYSFIY